MVKASLDWSDDTELLSLVLTVCPKKDAALPANYTKGLHPWFLKQVLQKDPQLSQYLHDGQSDFRVFWYYGPNRDELRILAITPHP